MRYRTGRALKSMKSLPNFDSELQKFVREECRVESENILKNKDPPVKSFDLASLKDFEYGRELEKLTSVSPLLMASMAGSISGSKEESYASLSRKGFGGSRKGEEISLTPALVQCATMIMRNRHPNSISTVPCINSLNNWAQQIPQRYFYLTNSLGFSFRFVNLRNLMTPLK